MESVGLGIRGAEEHGILNEGTAVEFYRRRPLESSATTQSNSRANSSNFTCKHCLQCCNLRHSNNIVMGDLKGGKSFTIK